MENTELIYKAICYAKDHYSDTSMSVEMVADHAGFSMDYFNRIFLAHTGFTVMAYVNYMRVKKAVALLRNTDKTVLEIALEVGYDSHEGFIKAFKKHYGVTPSDYRKKNQNHVLSWGELTDSSYAHRFLHEHTDFTLVDTDEVIDYLLEKDSKQYGYFCTSVKGYGLALVAPNGDFTKGLIGIGDDRQGGMWLELVSDDLDLICAWLKRFRVETTFYSTFSPDTVEQALKSNQIEYALQATPQSLYFGAPLPCHLPTNIQVRQLTHSDKDAIIKWANGKKDGYIQHLLNEQHYNDPSVLEYGVFENEELTAVAGGYIEDVHGFRLNNCCNIRFAEGKADDNLYRNIFAYVVNDVLSKNILPFDDLQHGDYAKVHGNFTAVDMGFTTVSWRYEVIHT